jgi:hypothetical protein
MVTWNPIERCLFSIPEFSEVFWFFRPHETKRTQTVSIRRGNLTLLILPKAQATRTNGEIAISPALKDSLSEPRESAA